MRRHHTILPSPVTWTKNEDWVSSLDVIEHSPERPDYMRNCGWQMSNDRRHARFSSHVRSSPYCMIRKQALALKRPSQMGFSPSYARRSAYEKVTLVGNIEAQAHGVHKRCAWRVDNHVDERPIARRIAAPHTLPNRQATHSVQFHMDAVLLQNLAE